MSVDKYLTAADFSGRALYYIGLRSFNFIFFFALTFIIYYVFVRKVELPTLKQQVKGHNSVANVSYGYKSGITSSGKGYHCIGNNCKGGDCYGENCEAGWCYGTGCHAGDCYGLNCIPGKCKDPYCNKKKQDRGICEPLCYDGKAYNNFKSLDYEVKKRLPEKTYFNPINQCSGKYISNLIKNDKKTWNFYKKSATFFKTGKKTVDEINNPPDRQAGEHITIVDERNVYKSDPFLFQNNNCDWCADIKGHEICSTHIPVDIGPGKVKWVPDNKTSCDLYDKKSGKKKECKGNFIKKIIYKSAKDQIKLILSNRRLRVAERYYEIEKIRGDEYEHFCFDELSKINDRKKRIFKSDDNYKDNIGCSRIIYPKCLPIKNFKNVTTCKYRVYRLGKFKKKGKDINENDTLVEFFKPVQYAEFLPEDVDELRKDYPEKFRSYSRPSNYRNIVTNPKKERFSHGYQATYTTFSHHLPIFSRIEKNKYIYKCFWCEQECVVENLCLPVDDKNQIAKCINNTYDHHLVKMEDDNGNVYSKCIKCDKFCPKFTKRKRKKFNNKFIINIITICVILILFIILIS